MRTSIKLGAVLSVAVVGTVLSVGSSATAGPAAHRGTTTIQSCYGGAVSYTSYPGNSSTNSYWPERGVYALTSGSCNDINVKTNATRDVTVCFKRTGSCNGWHRASSGQWTVVASSVLSNTDFYVQFKGASVSSGLIAY
jgi:hypothetical protein